ncbi:MAG: bifunctional isocitrate dehydrogenase kinase/phosphatase [Deltaproteobacteria bacterium]
MTGSDPRVQQITSTIITVLDSMRAEHRAITRKARVWFETRDWKAAQAGAVERLGIYAKVKERMKQEARAILQDDVLDRALWEQVKIAYSKRIAYRSDEELAETFFNSVTRALFRTSGVDTEIEFVWFDNEILPSGDETPIYQSFFRTQDTKQVVGDILDAYAFAVPYQDAARCALRVAAVIDRHLTKAWLHAEFDAIEVAKPVFFRNKGAYLVGRVRRANRALPFVLPLVNEEGGVRADAVLLTEDEASKVFSFTRFYFFVDAERPSELIGFLRSILPVKPIAELYIALGYVKHGKTVLYRGLHRHLAHTTDKFRAAPGVKGMVMTVFMLPSLELVFKIIRDKFEAPKTASREDVKDTYRLVFAHERVGRLIDAQEFEALVFDKERFEPELLDELLEKAGQTVHVRGDKVVIDHLYTERRLNPLNLYVEEVNAERAERAVIDYGHAIKDLAKANIFPGDLLVKNFGVTRHGRVVFYDYDELCPLNQVQFRRLPEPADDDEEMASEPWFFVGENDVFPQEFARFLWRTERLREVMREHHGVLFDVPFWQQTQEQVAAGELLDVFPYDPSARLEPAPSQRPDSSD